LGQVEDEDRECLQNGKLLLASSHVVAPKKTVQIISVETRKILRLYEMHYMQKAKIAYTQRVNDYFSDTFNTTSFNPPPLLICILRICL
jgi:hypothetical protein